MRFAAGVEIEVEVGFDLGYLSGWSDTLGPASLADVVGLALAVCGAQFHLQLAAGFVTNCHSS